MKKICSNCKWWSQVYSNVCNREGDRHTETDPQRSFIVEATASDDTGLEAHLVTAPSFGCVQFEVKTN